MFQYHHIPLDSEQEFVDRATAEIEQAIADAIEERGTCVLGLSGGSTPRPIYEELGKLVAVEWDKVTVFLVDERYVLPDHKESNQRLVRETLLTNANVGNVIFPDTSLLLEECVDDYERRLPNEVDIVTLGLGEDGHIASLFPGDVGALEERNKHVLHAQTDTFAIHDRITVTLSVLRSARSAFFFLKGEGKKKIFEEVLSANVNSMKYPAHALLQSGRTTWLTVW